MVEDNNKATEIMNRLINQPNLEWKILFEAVMMFMRLGKFSQAEELVK